MRYAYFAAGDIASVTPFIGVPPDSASPGAGWFSQIVGGDSEVVRWL